jgi:tetratricopeptide (TPR) repeat protein
MKKVALWSAIALTLSSSFPLLPAIALPNTAAIPDLSTDSFTEPLTPPIDRFTQQWLDRSWQIAAKLSDPEIKADAFVRLAYTYYSTYQDRQKGAEAASQAIAAAQTITDPANKGDTLLQILLTQDDADPQAAAETLKIFLESIPAIADIRKQDGLLEFAILTAIRLEPSVQLTPAARPFAIVERICNRYTREYQRSEVVKALAGRLVSQGKLQEAIDLIQQTPLLPTTPAPQDAAEFQNPTNDDFLKAKLNQLDPLISKLFLLADGDGFALVDQVPTSAVPPIRAIAQAWINQIQAPQIKAEAQTQWVAHLIRLGQEPEAIALFQQLLQTIPASRLSAPQKAELWVSLLQASSESNPNLFALRSKAMQAFQVQFNAMGNAEAVQSQKVELLTRALDSVAIYGEPEASVQLIGSLVDLANTFSDLKLRANTLYAIAFRYDFMERKTEAIALYHQILPMVDHLEDPSQAIALLTQLGHPEAAIEVAKTSGIDYVLSDTAASLASQQSLAPALELARLVQDPTAKAMALAQISSVLATTNPPNPNALEPMKEALAFIQTLPEPEKLEAIHNIGYFYHDGIPLQLLNRFEPSFEAGILTSILNSQGWSATEKNTQIAERLTQLLPQLSDGDQKTQALIFLTVLDAQVHPDRVMGWVDQIPRAVDQTEVLLKAADVRSLMTVPSY